MPDFSAYIQIAAGQPILTGLIAAVLLLAIGAALFRKSRPWQSYLRPQPVLTANEREFFHRLTRATNYHVFPQVAMSAFITVDGQLSERHRFSIRRRFGWKYADFVICQPFTLDVLLVIELDDRTHDAGSDRKRDSMTKAAGYQTLRFQSKQKPSVAELADLFSKLLPTLQR
jgi:very-short-patch-repair endonuclease